MVTGEKEYETISITSILLAGIKIVNKNFKEKLVTITYNVMGWLLHYYQKRSQKLSAGSVYSMPFYSTGSSVLHR